MSWHCNARRIMMEAINNATDGTGRVSNVERMRYPVKERLVKLVPLTQNKLARVCDCHADLVGQYKWSYHRVHADQSVGYAVTNQKLGNGRRRMISMHRLILGLECGPCVDHRDGDRLNNQCFNLRRATKMQNGSNRKTHNNNSSGMPGVSWYKKLGKWMVYIKVNWERKHIGYYSSFEEAVVARRAAELEYFGEFARLNERHR